MEKKTKRKVKRRGGGSIELTGGDTGKELARKHGRRRRRKHGLSKNSKHGHRKERLSSWLMFAPCSSLAAGRRVPQAALERQMRRRSHSWGGGNTRGGGGGGSGGESVGQRAGQEEKGKGMAVCVRVWWRSEVTVL